MKHNVLIISGVVIALVLSIYGAFFGGSTTVVEKILDQVGAVATLDGVDSPFVSINGVKTYYGSRAMVATSSVACSIQNPYTATSSVERITADITANGLGAQTFDISTSTTQYASSSPAFIRAASIAAGAKKSVVWHSGVSTSSPLVVGTGVLSSAAFLATGESPYILGPSEWLTLRIATSSAGTFSTYLTGMCRTELRAIN